jgi:hypothetical protein
VPLIRNNASTAGDREEVEQQQVLGVLDVDSEHENHFDDVDRRYLEELVRECVVPLFN